MRDLGRDPGPRSNLVGLMKVPYMPETTKLRLVSSKLADFWQGQPEPGLDQTRLGLIRNARDLLHKVNSTSYQVDDDLWELDTILERIEEDT